MIYVYYTYQSEENHERLLTEVLPGFPVYYQEKIKRYRRWQDAQLSLLGRVLLYKAAEEIYGHKLHDKEIKYTKHNKPYFEDHVIQFNITHSEGIVVCALTDLHEVGVDIEIITDFELDSFKFEMTEKERQKIESSDNIKDAFFEYWTQKEAVIKAHGHGLTIPLKSFEIVENKTEINEEKFYLKEIKIDEKYKCHISLKTSIGEIYLKEEIIKTQYFN
ncbi:MAG: 4'-phosphopantetheinyl transferase superfamily protein [Flavobacterium sp.]|uniref:4'-phosphopantetheinyl transferase family protein n=1 Tax=Flavobacterium sp. TaxID=239 RepID=UPI001B107134|nr:4'-phosphopantetheinyl transferase superfamily protein [Flavobacterium sp.]MBO9586226.1 4'-phosphopantetheinyl transferase superfamily protein [Flavobacterium sp.]